MNEKLSLPSLVSHTVSLPSCLRGCPQKYTRHKQTSESMSLPYKMLSAGERGQRICFKTTRNAEHGPALCVRRSCALQPTHSFRKPSSAWHSRLLHPRSAGTRGFVQCISAGIPRAFPRYAPAHHPARAPPAAPPPRRLQPQLPARNPFTGHPAQVCDRF